MRIPHSSKITTMRNVVVSSVSKCVLICFSTSGGISRDNCFIFMGKSLSKMTDSLVIPSIPSWWAHVSKITLRLKRDLVRPYKMVLWPLWPVIGLVGCAVVFSQQTLTDIGICAAIFIVAGIYYIVYLRPRKDTRWVMLAPAHHDDAEPVIAEPVGGLDATAGS
jgi:hypothetical protein